MSIAINKTCRICRSNNLKTVINLGNQALTGVFIKDGNNVDKYNMSLSMCQDCGLTQINEIYDLDLLYGDGYGYESALNSSMVSHLKSKAYDLTKILNITDNDIVIDIGSNDATTLSFFDHNIIKIGVDFTGSKFASNYKNINAFLIPDFFPSPKLDKLLENRKAKLISSYSCFYDLPDPVYFAKEVAKNLEDDGLWCLEQSYLPLMLETNSFDTICHEHIEYYKLQDIKNICDQANLEIKDIEFNDINGGSFSVTVGHKNNIFQQSSKTKEILLKEANNDWNQEFKFFNERIAAAKFETINLLEKLQREGKRVAGLGASTKGNVLLQYFGINSDHIDVIGEVNPNKFGCTTPGTNIPIICEKELLASKPDYLFVLPWHFKKFFIENFKEKGISLIFPLPKLEIIDFN
jgi:hypothetical protein